MGENMKYKVGDRFLVEITAVNEGSMYPYNLGNGILMSEERVDELFRPADMTAEEAWEIARKVVCDYENGGLSSEDFADIFGERCFEDAMLDHTPQQAKAKIEAWEAAREIKVGDEVHVICERCTKKDIYYFVMKDPKISNNGYAEGIDKNGEWHSWRRSEVKKTGRHIDIRGLLDQIGGAE